MSGSRTLSSVLAGMVALVPAVRTQGQAGWRTDFSRYAVPLDEIVNDMVGGTPVAVTYCPLCNTALVFDRRVDGMLLDFGTTGRLRYSDLVMYDRQTESWWQQATGEAIVGKFAGRKLEQVNAPLVSWGTFKRSSPNGLVLSRETGFDRPYGDNPYVRYDDPK